MAPSWAVPVNVNSGGNPAFWAAGLLKGASVAANRVALAIMAIHGGRAGGVHVVSTPADGGHVEAEVVG